MKVPLQRRERLGEIILEMLSHLDQPKYSSLGGMWIVGTEVKWLRMHRRPVDKFGVTSIVLEMENVPTGIRGYHYCPNCKEYFYIPARKCPQCESTLTDEPEVSDVK